MNKKFKRGVKIVVENWMNIRSGEAVLIITDLRHRDEMKEVQKHAQSLGANVVVRILPGEYAQNLSAYFDDLAAHMPERDVIIGATHYSLITTEVVKRAVRSGIRFLSLPMATNDGRSLLEYDFITMDPDRARFVAKLLLRYINESTYLRVTTDLGTDITFRKQDRNGSYFNGMPKENKGFTSSSFEVYVAIEEDRSFGTCVIDGSLGYPGKVDQPFKIRIEAGKLVEIEQSGNGELLDEYMKSFRDERVYFTSEFGIGLNTYAKCEGRSYIEDESAHGTFHIGFGRNIALGGEFEADGHFDLVIKKPSIYADNRMIMDKGVIVVPEPEVW